MAQYLTVTALTKYLKYKFDNDKNLRNVYLKGEISNFKRHSSGHLYFTIKDDTAQISAIMFRSNASKIAFEIEDGMNVLVIGYISVYEYGGNYQLYVTELQEDGRGALYIQFEQLKQKLEEQGLFSETHKKNIPKFPKAIGIITSNTGAALQDILNTIQRRYPLAEVLIYPTLVQGDQAKFDIVKQIKKANQDHLVDTIILARGGGSIEDLWPFNEEIVARAVFQSELPIISGVGHETDFTIVDFVSDLRAPTPTGAAELSVPNRWDLIETIRQLRLNMEMSVSKQIKQYQQTVLFYEKARVFTQPESLFHPFELKLDYLTSKLERSNPIQQIDQLIEKKEHLEHDVKQSFLHYMKATEYNFAHLMEKLMMLNPFHVMEKGYSIVKSYDKVITSVEQVNVNDEIDIILKDGTIHSRVEGKEHNNE